jgi:hypothetical protein
MLKKYVGKRIGGIIEDRYLLEEGVCRWHMTDEKRPLERKDNQRLPSYF